MKRILRGVEEALRTLRGTLCVAVAPMFMALSLFGCHDKVLSLDDDWQGGTEQEEEPEQEKFRLRMDVTFTELYGTYGNYTLEKIATSIEPEEGAEPESIAYYQLNRVVVNGTLSPFSLLSREEFVESTERFVMRLYVSAAAEGEMWIYERTYSDGLQGLRDGNDVAFELLLDAPTRRE